jgi:putative hydrolase of the HAD superfamily
LPSISALFWDVGGVILSNAWDRAEREQALAKFALNPLEFQDRHELVVSSFERGKISLAEYLDRTVFYQPRPFTREDFKNYMLSRSQPKLEALAFVRQLAHTGKYLMATINNESTDLNDYRIRTFQLKELFDLFISSCFVGLRKPERDIYRLALAITQRAPEECCFIDDRGVNLEQAACMGIHTIQMHSVGQLQQDLANLGVRTD